MHKHKNKTGIHYRLMSLEIRLRALLSGSLSLLDEAGIKEGDLVLDFGCGPGIYSFAAARITTHKGTVYAMDIVEDAVEEVRKRTEKNGIKNVVPIHSGLDTRLSGESIDVILAYNVFHHIDNPDNILKEFHRVLKPLGVVSFYDKHMDEDEIKHAMEKSGLFSLKEKKKNTHVFFRV